MSNPVSDDLTDYSVNWNNRRQPVCNNTNPNLVTGDYKRSYAIVTVIAKRVLQTYIESSKDELMPVTYTSFVTLPLKGQIRINFLSKGKPAFRDEILEDYNDMNAIEALKVEEELYKRQWCVIQ